MDEEFPTDDELIASFSILNLEPPSNAPDYEVQMMPEMVALCQASRDFLYTDVFSQRFRDLVCTSIPPPPGSDAAPVVSHYAKKENIYLSYEMPVKEREVRRHRFAVLQEIWSARLKWYIGRFKEFILSEMCEIEADKRVRNLSAEQSGVGKPGCSKGPTVIGRPTSVDWRFFQFERPVPPEPIPKFAFQILSTFHQPGEEVLMNSLEHTARLTHTLKRRRREAGEFEMEVSSERWRGDTEIVTESSSQAIRVHDLRPDLRSPPEISISPNSGIPPNELLTPDEEARRIATENRNNTRFRRDNEVFVYKKSMLRRFLEECEAEGHVNEPSSGASAFPSSGSSAFPSSGASAVPSSGASAFPGSGSSAIPSSSTSTRPASFVFKKSELIRFLQERGAERHVNEPISGASAFPRSGASAFPSSSTSTRPVSLTANPYELSTTDEEGVRTARENRANERYQELVEGHERHIIGLERCLLGLLCRFGNRPQILTPTINLVQCLLDEHELLESFKEDSLYAPR